MPVWNNPQRLKNNMPLPSLDNPFFETDLQEPGSIASTRMQAFAIGIKVNAQLTYWENSQKIKCPSRNNSHKMKFLLENCKAFLINIIN